MKDRELKERVVKIKIEIEELFFKPIIVSIDNMDNFENNEMKKIRSIKNTWYDWLIIYIPEPIRKSEGGFKDKVICLFKTNTPKQAVYGRGKKLRKPKTQTKIDSIRNPFRNTKKERQEVEDRIMRDI